MGRSLRLKVALAFSTATIVLLGAQALGVRTLAESQEERLIRSVIADDMVDQVRSYRANPVLLPPFNPQLHAHVTQNGGTRIAPPAWLVSLPEGIHEVILDGREIHVAIAVFGGKRIVRLYDYSAYERHFKDGVNMLMVGTGLFLLPAIWLAFWLSGLLVRQVSGLAQQVSALRSGAASDINPGKYDEREVVELAHTVNDYHGRMAAMIEREKEFASNVSHELRTPLTTIRTSCELLEQAAASFDVKSRQRLHQIEQAAHHMHALIESLLALAREESAKEVEPLHLAAAIDAVLQRFAEALERKCVSPIMVIAADVGIIANAAALDIVLSNVIDNALRHTEQGTLRFTYQNSSLCIEDTGTGIAAEAMPQVFQRYYRAPDERANGFGIGLAIVKKICDRYGWPVHVESKSDSGTRITLGLPEAWAHSTHDSNFTKTS